MAGTNPNETLTAQILDPAKLEFSLSLAIVNPNPLNQTVFSVALEPLVGSISKTTAPAGTLENQKRSSLSIQKPLRVTSANCFQCNIALKFDVATKT
jgi:hypothetical protein